MEHDDVQAFVKAYLDQLNGERKNLKDVESTLQYYIDSLESRRESELAKLVSLKDELNKLALEKKNRTVPSWMLELGAGFIILSMLAGVGYFMGSEFSILETAVIVVVFTIIHFGILKDKRNQESRRPLEIQEKIFSQRLLLEKIEGQIEAAKFAWQITKT